MVGSCRESSNATGVDGDQGDNGAAQSGAAYVFDVATWSDEDCGLPGITGNPALIGTGTLAGGSSNSIDLANAAPSAPSGLFVSLSSTPVPFKGGTLKPSPPLVSPIVLATRPAGALSLPFKMPSGLASGTDLWFQFAVQDAPRSSASRSPTPSSAPRLEMVGPVKGLSMGSFHRR